MKRILDILTIVVLVLATACSKDNIAGNGNGNTIKISLVANDEITVKSSDSQGNTITDMTVWAYPITTVAFNQQNIEVIHDDALPVAFGTTETGNETMTLNVPPDFQGKKYRFFVIANKEKFGKIYKARTNYGAEIELELNEHLTYKELSTAVFDANASGTGIMKTAPGLQAANSMPFTHWKDVTIDQGTTEILIPVYRSVAKATFKAKLIEDSGSKDLLVIKSVEIKSAHNFHIPQQGFMFSTHVDINNAAAPAIFGEYNDVLVAEHVDIPLVNSDVKIQKEASNTLGTVASTTASAFLYENHNGNPWPTGGEPSPSSSDPNTYDYGAYYMEISYDYGTDSDSDGDIETPKSRTNYVPIPPVVRNRSYIVDATFDIRSGNVILSYSVKDWVQDNIADDANGANGNDDDVQNVTFAYPTFEIWPVKTKEVDGNIVYDYDQPITKFHSSDPEPFEFYFRMQPYGDGESARKWTVSLADANDDETSTEEENNAFKILVYKSSDNTVTGTWELRPENEAKTFTAAGELYKISIVATGSLSNARTVTTNVIITYYASWLGGNDHLLINSGGGGTLWSNSGHERHQILVTQGADI